MTRALRLMLAAQPLLLLWPALRHFVESSMALHMLLEFPLLFAAGWVARGLLWQQAPDRSSWDWRGLAGSSLLLAVSAFWMIPAALDLALLDGRVAAAKYLSWWLAGAAMAGSWHRLDAVIVLFVGGNLIWMMAAAGLIYQSSLERLCVNYLQNEQAWTGAGLIACSVALGGTLLWRFVGSGRARPGSLAMGMLLVLGLLLTDRSALAIPADVRLDQLHHARWTTADGAPVGVRAMAQTADGALWLGSEYGLYRFDGVKFERVHAPETSERPYGNVSALLAAPDGSLWIGLRFGGIFRLKEGQTTAFSEAQGLPTDGSILKLLLAADGSLWAGTSAGLFLLREGIWSAMGAELGHPDSHVQDLAVDREGRLWIVGADGVFSLPAGAHKVTQHVALSMQYAHVAASADGSVWYGPDNDQGSPGLFVLQPAPTAHAKVGIQYPPSGWASRFIADRDDGLWAAYGTGVIRLPRPSALRSVHRERLPEQAQLFGREHGLSGFRVYYVFEDRDGSIWISTERGLDRFRQPRFEAVSWADPASSLVAGDEGGIWSCSAAAGVITGQETIRLFGRRAYSCEAIDIAPDGKRWFATNTGLWWWDEGTLGHLAYPEDAAPVLSVPTLKVDGAGVLWVSLVRKGLFRYERNRWTHVRGGEAGFPASRPISMARDAQGRVWLGYPRHLLAVVEGAQARSWGKEAGLRVGNVQVIVPRGAGLLVGGSEGLALMQGDRFTMLRASSGEHFEGTAGIVAGGADGTWIHSTSGVFRIDSAELDRVARDETHLLTVERFDDADGLRGIVPPGWPWPSAARTSDGRLWFSTTAAVYTLDPARIERNRRAPALELRGLRLDDADAVLSDGQRLPVGVTRIGFSYAALHITMPERVRYRYRLDGVDRDWQHTSSRNTSYTNLAPGDYTFRVSAANEDGVWAEPGVSTRFSIPAPFYQAAWFYALCVAAVALLAWGAHLWRLRRLLARLRLRNEAQTQERARIARDLHDTLLQSTQGLMLTVQSLAERTSADHPDKPRIERVLARADQTLREGRRKVMELRADEGGDEADLEDWLRDLACELSERGPATVSVQVQGISRCLQPRARAELLSVGREAMLNAQKHAQAQRIELLLAYDADALRLRVSDDGLGMAPMLMDGSGETPGHWGLAGMRERAAALGAQLSIRREDAGLTVVELVVPAALAYGPAERQTPAVGEV